MPTPHPSEHDVALTLTQTNADYAGELVETPDDVPGVLTHVAKTSDAELGVVGHSGISLIIARDGVVVGVVEYAAAELGWSELGVVAADQGGYGGWLVAPWVFCPGEDTSTESDFEPGTYDVVGITRVFSTPESVALYQTLGFSFQGWSLDPTQLDPQGIYLPGSYDCAQTIAQQSPARPCLPDFTSAAKFDADASTVTMLYETKDLVEEFSAVLVSEPVTVTIPGKESLAWTNDSAWESAGTFDSIDDYVCGASAGYSSLDYGSSATVSLVSVGSNSDAMRAGGDFDATALATGFPDVSRVELLPGARIVYLQYSEVDLTDANVTIGVETVVASAGVSAAQGVTADRFVGPQPLQLTAEPLVTCEGVLSATITRDTTPVLVGQWRITTPDGAVSTVDVGQYLYGYLYGY